MRHAANEGFILTSKEIKRNIFVPRYYDPRIEEELDALSGEHTLKSIDELVAAGEMRHDHGTYIPKIHYGAGPVPYIRTSDLANWEVMASPKHGIPVAVYEEYKEEQDVEPGDIFFVHEGTYLIGTAAMVTSYDGLYCINTTWRSFGFYLRPLSAPTSSSRLSNRRPSSAKSGPSNSPQTSLIPWSAG